MAKNTISVKNTPSAGQPRLVPGVEFARKTICWWLPLLYLLICDTFYLRTYDSAQVKITLVQMGGVALFALWGCLISLEGKHAFKKSDMIFLSPFLMCLIYVVISFLHAPYKGPSVDDFARYIFYMTAALVVIREMDENAINRVTKILIIAAYITIGYGFIQWLDSAFAPPKGMGAGIDPFIWRGAFGARVFSTYGNPNFFGDFLVLIFPVLVSQYLKTRSFYLLPLIFLDVFDLYCTTTKGAWIGFGFMFFIFALLYLMYFSSERIRNMKWKLLAVSTIVPIVCMITVFHFLSKGGTYTSVKFRVFTWLSTWEMIETHPLAGVGVGSFKVIYPAFRRPKIFHIEGKHNTETDHAEDEFLEQFMDNGVLGFGLFIWLVLFTLTTGLRGLKSFSADTGRGARPPPRAYDLLGYLVAFIGMLSHNFFDVSLRFVSSGVYLGLLPGLVINLARGCGLWELHAREINEDAQPEPSAVNRFVPVLLNVLRFASIGGLGYTAYLILTQFNSLQGPMPQGSQGGEILQWSIAWGVMIAVVLGLGASFSRIAVIGKSLIPPLIIIAMLWPLYYFWGFFKADVYHNMAIFFSKQSRWDEALSYYRQVNDHNPYFMMAHYFSGNVFNDRFDMNKQYRPEWGDSGNIARTDLERALDSYEKVRKMAPNYVQMHHQVGLLYMKAAQYYGQQGNSAESGLYWDKALARFELYHNLDPVFAYNYYRKAMIYMARGEHEKARLEYSNYINAEHCYEKGHLHEDPEAYTNLAYIEQIMGKLQDAEKHYKRALELNPGYSAAQQKLQQLYQRIPVRPAAPSSPPKFKEIKS